VPAIATAAEFRYFRSRYKAGQGKRTVADDARILRNRLLPAFGPTQTLRTLTGPLIAQYEKQRIGEVSPYTVANELGVLRHLLRLAQRWGYLPAVPEITLPKKPPGRLRYLEVEEIAQLLDACRASRNPYLATIVTLAVSTGMRKGEILGLEWERIDLATARITLYRTKNGQPRGVPLNRDGYEALIALEPDPGKRVGWCFRRRDGSAWGQMRTAFDTALRRAGIKAF
jgi:integrase